MKTLFLFILLMQTFLANDKDWEIDRANFYFENDFVGGTDSEYTAGSRLSVLLNRPDGKNEWLNIPFTEKDTKTHYISFSLTQQIFTPKDLTAIEVIEDDIPYAGWIYLEMGLHQSSKNELDSLSFQVGIVGPSSKMEELQNWVHKITGSREAVGWENQLNSELGIQLNYEHKWRIVPHHNGSLESDIIPYLGLELGNVSIKANSGILYRIGWNIQKDFGSRAINGGGENGIPIDIISCPAPETWGVSLNLATGTSLVVRDIFLDGSTFSRSHSVEKEVLTAYGSVGLSGRYKSFLIEYFQTFHTPRFEGEKQNHSIGSLIISYLF